MHCLRKFKPSHAEIMLCSSQTHRTLHYNFKTVGSGRFHSVRLGLHYRGLGLSVPSGVHWFWVGTHGDYDKLIG